MKKQSNLKSAKNQNVLLFLAILIIAILGICYNLGIFEDTQIQDLVTSSKSQDPSMDAITQAEAKIPPIETKKFDFQELMKSNSCSSLGTLCEDIGLKILMSLFHLLKIKSLFM